jgi:hypothetical protein
MDRNIYICDDRPIEMSDRVKNMTEDELDKEFARLFGDAHESANKKAQDLAM